MSLCIYILGVMQQSLTDTRMQRSLISFGLVTRWQIFTHDVNTKKNNKNHYLK